MILIAAILGYAVAGLVVALIFVTVGVTRVLPQPVSVTFGARILLLPGAALMWPYVLWRLVRATRSP